MVSQLSLEIPVVKSLVGHSVALSAFGSHGCEVVENGHSAVREGLMRVMLQLRREELLGCLLGGAG